MYLPRPPQRSQRPSAPPDEPIFNFPPPRRSIPNAAEKCRFDSRASSRLQRNQDIQRSPRRRHPNQENHKALRITNAPPPSSFRGPGVRSAVVGNYRSIGQQARRNRERLESHTALNPSIPPPPRNPWRFRLGTPELPLPLEQNQDNDEVEEGQSREFCGDHARIKREEEGNEGGESEGKEGRYEKGEERRKGNVEGEEKVKVERRPLPRLKVESP